MLPVPLWYNVCVSKSTPGFQIAKLDDSQCLVFGYANVSVSKSTAQGAGGEVFFDLQEDAIRPDDLEKGAYGFVLDFREADEMHEGSSIGDLVESIVFTPDKLIKFVTDPTTGDVDTDSLKVLQKVFPTRWWVGFKLAPEAYAGVKSGKYTMFSVAGEADRKDAE